jgi:predicted Zn-dependent peptidase
LSNRYKDSYWTQTAAISTNDTGAALKEIMYEIDTLQKNPPPIEELDGVKNYAAGIFVLQNSTRNGIINYLNQIDLQELPDTYLTNYVSDVFALTPEQISAVTAEYLRQEDMTLTVVGDRGQISEQVAPYLEAEDQ